MLHKINNTDYTICVDLKLFHDGGPYHIGNSPLICSAN